jgi:hypothetical protein
MSSFSGRNRIVLATPEPPARLFNYDGIASHPKVDWRSQLPFPCDSTDLENIDAVIISDEWAPQVRACIAACKLKGVPTFHILDGVIRWKNLFENPRSLVPENGTPFMRPLMSDMTFVMGDLQAAVLRWLGNTMICVSGLPRFASYEPKSCSFGDHPHPRLLLASSNRPWYTESQRDFFIPSFQRLLDVLKRDCASLGVPLHCRLSPLVEWENVEPAWLGPHPPFHEQLQSCSALITTPSTIAVEAMLLGIPTLIFDPWADPILTPSPWVADHANAVSTLLPSLLSPSKEKASLQDFILHLTVRDSRNSTELIVNVIAQEVEKRRAQFSGSTSQQPDQVFPMEAPPIKTSFDWDLDTPHVVGLIQTIPQLVAMLHEERRTMHMITQLSDTIQSTHTPFNRVVANRLKYLLKQLFVRQRRRP